ncbi:DGQHR domain-containing protein [Caballeronia glebae]|uniref:DGQHR domain-containing protein n=1 Tax=Caballeronia glebae TaxID=1777143 RepID=UPI00135A1C6B|nr:DGQHR domain-containing protein [Caballeronia glebae]
MTKQDSNDITQVREYHGFCFQQRRGAGPRLVMFHAPVHEILQWAAVGELGPNSRGPQREKKEARVQAISKFLSADPQNTIPSALILAFGEGNASFAPLEPAVPGSSAGKISINLSAAPAATIVDGQHRLFGIDSFDPQTHVPIVALLDADSVERAFQFLVINNKSSRVAATHTKALLAKMKGTPLATRLKGAKLAFDVEGIKDVDLINSDPDSPFFQTIDWTTTPQENRMVQATSIEISLDYIVGLGIPEYQDRDVCRSVFLTIWKAIKAYWPSLWVTNSRLISKIGIICLTRFVADRITNWADSDDLDIEVTDLEQIESQTKKIIKHMDMRFWTTPWSEKAQGGFDTNQGRERVMSAITQLYRNGKRDIAWYSDIDIIERSAAKE